MIKPVQNSITIAISGGLILMLAGCAGYKARPLVRLTPAECTTKKDTIMFIHQALTRKDCEKYLDRDVIKMGYQPVNVSIVNNTDRSFIFKRSNINLPTVEAEAVAQLVHTNTAGRAAGYGVAGLFFWPLLIPAIVDGVGSSNANKKLDADFSSKVLRDQIISPCETVSGLIFVPVESYKPDFEIKLIDIETSKPLVLRAGQPASQPIDQPISEFCQEDANTAK